MGKSRDPDCHLGLFDLCSGRATASVTEAEGNQQIFVGIFVLILLPYAANRLGTGIAVIGVIILSRIGRGHKMSRHFRSVHASPAESVVGQTVRVVPADLGGHEGIDT